MTHNIIKTENYLLVVDDSEIKEGELVLSKLFEIVHFGKNYTQSLYKKIIAHLPLNNSPILQSVDLLPPLEQEDDAWKHGLEDELNKLPYTKHLDDGQYNDGQLTGFEFGANWGFNKAKEKYKYTEEDMRKAMVLYSAWITGGTPSLRVAETAEERQEQIIQSLSQPKIPIGFECQTFDTGDDKLDGTHILGIRTTANPQGQTVLVGKYIY